MELQLFDEVGEVLRRLVPADVGELHCRHHRYGIKVWFDAEKPTREHYEAQVIGAKHVREAKVLAIEVGFHAENRDPADNERIVKELLSRETRWRKALGDDPVAEQRCDPDAVARPHDQRGHLRRARQIQRRQLRQQLHPAARLTETSGRATTGAAVSADGAPMSLPRPAT